MCRIVSHGKRRIRHKMRHSFRMTYGACCSLLIETIRQQIRQSLHFGLFPLVVDMRVGLGIPMRLRRYIFNMLTVRTEPSSVNSATYSIFRLN